MLWVSSTLLFPSSPTPHTSLPSKEDPSFSPSHLLRVLNSLSLSSLSLSRPFSLLSLLLPLIVERVMKDCVSLLTFIETDRNQRFVVVIQCRQREEGDIVQEKRISRSILFHIFINILFLLKLSLSSDTSSFSPMRSHSFSFFSPSLPHIR